MQLRILGPLELIADHRLIKIGGPREHIVLAALALRANRVVTVEYLIDAVWGENPPTTARAQIQTCISGLRKVLDSANVPDAITTSAAGYSLRISDDDLDSEKFARLTAEARASAVANNIEAAALELRLALDLWYGPALAGLPSELVRRGAAVLDEARLAALEERLRLDLELGRHAEIAGELSVLAAEYPLRERLQGFLMLAHFRTGRQAEALQVYRQTRTTLDTELGVEPGPELRNMEQAVLRQDRSLDLPSAAGPAVVPAAKPPASPSQLPSSVADFIGRDTRIAEIKRLVHDQAPAGKSRYALPVIAISGRGGVGKSTLALRAAHELSAEFPDGHLYVDLGGPVGGDRTAVLLARFLRALGVGGSMIPDDADERAEMYRSRLASKRLLLVFDDARSEQQVTALLPGSPSCAVIVTSRVRLSGLAGARWIDLEVFDAQTSTDLLVSIAGAQRLAAEPDATSALVRYCGGLPLALRIAGARLVSRPHWRVAELAGRLKDERRRLDELSHHGLEVRSSIALTYHSLLVPTQRLFRLFASLQALDFPSWTAAALLDVDLVSAEDLIEQLIDAQMLEAVQGPTGDIRYRFHDLIRVYAQEQLMATESHGQRQDALTRLLGGWLALAEQAHRMEYGGDYTILHGSAPRWRPPQGIEGVDGDQSSQGDARSGGALVGNPMDWLENERAGLVCAVKQAYDAGLDEVCWDLALTSVSLFEVKGYLDDWRETAEMAGRLTSRTGNATGYAAMLYSIGSLHLFQKRLDTAEQSFASALEIFQAQGNVHGQALVLRNAALVDRLHGAFGPMQDKYTEGLAKMRAVGDLVGAANILRNLGKFRIDEGDRQEAARLLGEALSLCQQVGYRRGEAQVEAQLAELYMRTEQIPLARQALNRALRTVREIGDRMGEAHALYGLGIIRYREGRLDSAEATVVHALSLSQRVGNRFIEGQARFTLGEISMARGENATAIPHLREAIAAFSELNSRLWHAKTLMLLAEAAEGSSEPEQEGRHLDEAAALLSGVSSKEAVRLLEQLDTSGAWTG